MIRLIAGMDLILEATVDQPRRAVVLLSGGLDSATVLAIANAEGYETYALSFSYGQRHTVELDAAHRVAKQLGAARHIVFDLGMRAIGGSALTDDIDVPHHDSVDQLDSSSAPITYVPARNLIFLSVAAGWAETVGAKDIFIGANALDYSGYPDCRRPFLDKFEEAATLGTVAGADGGMKFRVLAPLVDLTKAQTIQRGLELGVDYSITHSCYDPSPSGQACATCDSCLLRKRGFEDLGLTDPVLSESVNT